MEAPNAMSLFSPLKLREVTLRNRIAVSPMCQYSAKEGRPTDWHFVHLGSRAVGGAGAVIFEVTAVEPRGRGTPLDLGLWDDGQIEPLARIARFVEEQGAVAGIQIGHAGRKASSRVPWDAGGGPLSVEAGGWPVVGPSALAYAPGHPTPSALSVDELGGLVRAFGAAARRALAAGFRLLEIHAAHGYLLHQFLSTISNRRTDGYGGSFENRTRFLREVVAAVRREWPERLPLFVRVSAVDWGEGGWGLEENVELARQLQPKGVDLIDCSSGGVLTPTQISSGPGYQTGFAERIRREAGIPTGAVGFITSPEQADHVIRSGQADLVMVARELLRDPYWPLRAAGRLREEEPWPKQYLRAR
jgi:2,4-dienoyl-CoA reductase-like NADH-dependent reductase (Old Yellow Enzyme family)